MLVKPEGSTKIRERFRSTKQCRDDLERLVAPVNGASELAGSMKSSNEIEMGSRKLICTSNIHRLTYDVTYYILERCENILIY